MLGGIELRPAAGWCGGVRGAGVGGSAGGVGGRGIKQRRLVATPLAARRVTAENAIAWSRDSASSSSGGDSEGKRSSSSFRAISIASLAIWLGSLPGFA